MKVIVLEACDGFTILVQDEAGRNLKRTWCSQEDTVEELVDVFQFLGFESSYEEDY